MPLRDFAYAARTLRKSPVFTFRPAAALDLTMALREE